MNTASYQNALNLAIAERIEYQVSKNDMNASMTKAIAEYKRDVSHARIAEIMMTSRVDANFINRQERVNARFNIKAAAKVVNVARYIAAVAPLNHYTKAIVLSTFALEAKSLHMTHKRAQAACSLSVKCDIAAQKHLVCYASHVDASTASTQSSSSLNTLQMYNILIEFRDAANVVSYRLNYDNINTLHLLDCLDCDYSDRVSDEEVSDALAIKHTSACTALAVI